jgi:hypothetical protein
MSFNAGEKKGIRYLLREVPVVWTERFDELRDGRGEAAVVHFRGLIVPEKRVLLLKKKKTRTSHQKKDTCENN